MWKGANFKMKIANVAGYRNYDRSEFSTAEALNADDSVLEGIYNKQYALGEFTDPSSFKSYSELNLKLTRVLGEEVKTNRSEADYMDEDLNNEQNEAMRDPVAVAADPIARADSDNDDTMSYFAKLAAEA